MANSCVRVPVSGGTTAPIPSTTLAIFACTFDNTQQTLVISNGTDYTFRDLSGALVTPIAIMWTFTAVPLVTTVIPGIGATANAVTIRAINATNLLPEMMGTIFLFGPGSRRFT